MTLTDAINILKNEKPHCGRKIRYTEGDICEAFDMAIKALEHEPRWIPVSKRLPKEGCKIYLTCFQDGYMATIMLGSDSKWLIEGEEPIAWMPLPEQYKIEPQESEEV